MSNLSLERGYIAQLIGIQWRRGAHGGQHFYNTLGLTEPTFPEGIFIHFYESKNIEFENSTLTNLVEPVMVDDPLPVLPIFGAYTDEQWNNLTKSSTDSNKGLLLEEVGPLFATAFMGASTYSGNINTAFTALQKVGS